MERSFRAAAKRAGEMGVVMSVGVGVAIFVRARGLKRRFLKVSVDNCASKVVMSLERGKGVCEADEWRCQFDCLHV